MNITPCVSVWLYPDTCRKYADLFWDLADGSLHMLLKYTDLSLVARLGSRVFVETTHEQHRPVINMTSKQWSLVIIFPQPGRLKLTEQRKKIRAVLQHT